MTDPGMLFLIEAIPIKHVATNMKSALTTQIHPGFIYNCGQRRNVLGA
jgi:hypothetical protein